MSSTKNEKKLAFDIDDMLDEINEDQKEALRKEGKEPYLTLEEGETVILIDGTVKPVESVGDFGKRLTWRVTKGGEKYDLTASMSLSKKLLKALKANINPMTIIRVGEAKQTRYSIKGLNKKA